MKLILQRVKEAKVSIDDEVVASINQGLLVLVGIATTDTELDIKPMIDKILKTKLWPESNNHNKWTKSVADNNYEILVVSQYTLYDKLKGTQLSFKDSMAPKEAKVLYEQFLTLLKASYKEEKVKSGNFGQYMEVTSTNDGPLTLVWRNPENNELQTKQQLSNTNKKPKCIPKQKKKTVVNEVQNATLEEEKKETHNQVSIQSQTSFLGEAINAMYSEASTKAHSGGLNIELFQSFIKNMIETIQLVAPGTITLSNNVFKNQNNKMSSLLIGIGLCTTGQLSQGLPFDFVGYFTLAVRMARLMGYEKIILFIGDTHAKTNSFAKGHEKYLDDLAQSHKKLIMQAVDNLSLSHTFQVILASEYHQDPEYQAIYNSIKDADNDYVRQQSADVEYWRLRERASLKISWLIDNDKKQAKNDERYFDKDYMDRFGEEMSFVYCKPGRTIDQDRQKVCPYTCIPGEKRLLLCKSISEQNIDEIFEKSDRAKEHTKKHLKTIVTEFESSFGEIQGETIQSKIASILRIFQEPNPTVFTHTSNSSLNQTYDTSKMSSSSTLSSPGKLSPQPLVEDKTNRNRYEWLRAMETQIQTQQGKVKSIAIDVKKEKFFVTFPYPYTNGSLHLGHGFSASKCEFQARFQKQLGKNVLFPFAFHCTGMPISAAADKLKREITSNCTVSKKDQNPTCYEILMQIGITEDDIPSFQSAEHWLTYFPPKAKADLQQLGIFTDWDRSFITTSKNPYYDSFIKWQFNILKKKEKIKFGKRHAVYSIEDQQACADHDRIKGEGVGPQEYTLVKIQLLLLPDQLKEQFQGKKIFLPAATLRPETMYGQTNCFVLPSGEYGLYEMKNEEYFICSERSIKNMAYQELTKVDREYPCLAKIKGQELIGLPLSAPLSKYEVVYALPMQTISMNKGTGIVTSVPSDAPDDYAALRDLQTKKGLRERFNVPLECVESFEPVAILEIPNLGRLSAVTLCQERGVQSQNDRDKLKEIKNICYLEGFNEGVMIVEPLNGVRVKDAKPIVKKVLIDANQACTYFETEELVVSRLNDECIVALVDQYILKYGEEEWKNFIYDHVASTEFNTYNPSTKQALLDTINWLTEWGCSRTQGLGTRIPWDDKFVIESLSDSTIYMAYYTIAHLLQGGVLDGSEIGSLGIKPEQLTQEVWDYIFLKGEYPDGCAIKKEALDQMRKEFEYWYPLDLRCSGKDLIKNHLVMSLYNHAAVWGDHDKLPRGFYCNGHIMLNGKKMSKTEGNFLTIKDCLDKYGSDATRMALADAGDGLDDANFDEAVANASILKLFNFQKWISDQLNLILKKPNLDLSQAADYDAMDLLFDNELNFAIEETKAAYEGIKYKNALKLGFYELQTLKDEYLLGKKGEMHPNLLIRFIQVSLILLNPICPHFSQYCWATHYIPALTFFANAPTFSDDISEAGQPRQTNSPNQLERRVFQYLKQGKKAIRQALETAQKSRNRTIPIHSKLLNCAILIAKDYPDWQVQILKLLQSFPFNEKNEIQGEYITKIRETIKGTKTSDCLKFANFTLKEAQQIGLDQALQVKTPFDEMETLYSTKQFLIEGIPSIESFTIYDEPEKIKDLGISQDLRKPAVPGKPLVFFY